MGGSDLRVPRAGRRRTAGRSRCRRCAAGQRAERRSMCSQAHAAARHQRRCRTRRSEPPAAARRSGLAAARRGTSGTVRTKRRRRRSARPDPPRRPRAVGAATRCRAPPEASPVAAPACPWGLRPVGSALGPRLPQPQPLLVPVPKLVPLPKLARVRLRAPRPTMLSWLQSLPRRTAPGKPRPTLPLRRLGRPPWGCSHRTGQADP